MVEQHLLAQFARNGQQLGVARRVNDALQRQIVEFDVALHIGIDQLHDIGR
ncbi:hypothetical protein D3C76_1841630 [compost metagenome]